MKQVLTPIVLGLALAAIPLASNALGRNEKGCLVGGAGGAVAGHFLGDHPVLGAAAGCAVGNYVARDRALKERQAAEKKRRDPAVAHNNAKRQEKRRHSEAPAG